MHSTPSPPPPHTLAVRCRYKEAFELWKSMKKRNPNKAHFGRKPRKNKPISRPLEEALASADLFCADVFFNKESDQVPDLQAEPGVESAAEAEERIKHVGEVFATIQSYLPPADYEVLV